MKLLTHTQLVNWLIYHRPLFDSHDHTSPHEHYSKPFMISYQGEEWRCNFTHVGNEPLEMYNEMASSIIETSLRIHQEISILYWYWTI